MIPQANHLRQCLFRPLSCLYVILLAMSSVQSLSVDVSHPQSTVHEGDSITIQCQADHVDVDSSITFTWWHADIVVASDGLIQDTLKYHVMVDGEAASILRISNINREDAGPYTCMALDNKSTLTASASAGITVLYPPAAHYPQCFVKNSILQDLVIQEGTSLTLVCSSDVAAPLPMISWYRVDKEPAEDAPATIVGGENFLRSEMTVVVSSGFQGAVFSCQLENTEFPNSDRECALGPITVLSADGTNKGHVNHQTASPTEASSDKDESDSPSDDRHANKEANIPTADTTSTPSPVACLAANYSFADRAMVPSTVILALLLFISVVLNFLQMVKNTQINAAKTSRQVACVRHQVIPENSYMAINIDNRTPSQYAELNMRCNKDDSIGHYYEYDMPMNGKEPYEDMTAGSNQGSRPLSAASKGTYEEMIDDSRPTSVASAASRPQSRNMRPKSRNEKSVVDCDYQNDAETYGDYENDEQSEKGHTYERTISGMSASGLIV